MESDLLWWVQMEWEWRGNGVGMECTLRCQLAGSGSWGRDCVLHLLKGRWRFLWYLKQRYNSTIQFDQRKVDKQHFLVFYSNFYESLVLQLVGTFFFHAICFWDCAPVAPVWQWNGVWRHAAVTAPTLPAEFTRSGHEKGLSARPPCDTCSNYWLCRSGVNQRTVR